MANGPLFNIGWLTQAPEELSSALMARTEEEASLHSTFKNFLSE